MLKLVFVYPILSLYTLYYPTLAHGICKAMWLKLYLMISILYKYKYKYTSINIVTLKFPGVEIFDFFFFAIDQLCCDRVA